MEQGTFQVFSFLQNRKVTEGQCGITLTGNTLSLAHATPQAEGQLVIKSCDYLDDITQENLGNTLTGLCKEQELVGVNCTWVLSPRDYSLLLIEQPNVPDAEVNSAAKWFIKDLIPYPLEDAALDTFPMPIITTKKMLYTSVTRMSYLQSRVEVFKSAGLKITDITIPELSLLGVIPPKAAPAGVTGFLYCDADVLQLLIYNASEFYLSRKLKLHTQAVTSGNITEQSKEDLTLEVQRSLDYFERQYRQAPPSRLYLTPELSELTPILNDRLGIKVENYALDTDIGKTDDLSLKELSRSLTAISGAIYTAGDTE